MAWPGWLFYAALNIARYYLDERQNAATEDEALTQSVATVNTSHHVATLKLHTRFLCVCICAYIYIYIVAIV